MNLFRFITGRRLLKVPGLGRAHYARWCSGRYGYEEIQYRADNAGRNLEKAGEGDALYPPRVCARRCHGCFYG